MRQLWAPWRFEYIDRIEDEKGCLFCTAPGEEDEKKALVLFKGSLSMVMLNKYPYNSGHLLVAPARHVARLEELTPEESIDIFRLLRHSTATLQKNLKPQGFNVGMNLGRVAGAGIDAHLHAHVLPRWSGDTNFMPVLTDVKVVSQHLEETYDRLRPLFERIS